MRHSSLRIMRFVVLTGFLGNTLLQARTVLEAEVLAGLSCRAEITPVLSTVAKHREWTADIGVYDTARTYRSPSDEIGKWIEFRIFRKDMVQIVIRTAYKVQEYSFGSAGGSVGCKIDYASHDFKYDTKRMKNAFSDASLNELLKKYRRGIIYVWSPNMPFSVQGMDVIRAAGRRMKIPVFMLADPHASRVDVNRVVASLPNESFELFQRGVGVHYPTIVMFKNGRIVGPSLPGVKSESIYQELILERLGN